jgi:hypothetical protein
VPNVSCSTWSEVKAAAWGDSAVLTLRYRSTAFFLKETLSERVSYGGCLRLALRDKIALVLLTENRCRILDAQAWREFKIISISR